MKSLDLTRKLNTIAENMKDLQIKGTTRIDWLCLTEREKVLFDRIMKIKDKYWPQLPPDDVLEENHALFVKGIEIVVRRAIDLFQNAVKVSDKAEDYFFSTSFSICAPYWFLHEMDRHIGQMRKEEGLFDKIGDTNDFEKAWKATIEYARTKGILYVKQLLGRRNIKTTLRYIQLVNLPQEEKFICKVAKDTNQAAELIEAGFEYVTGEYDDGGKLFRKRKLSYLGSSSIPGGSWSSLV